MRTDVYQVITDRVIGLLESGTVPWRKPWKGGTESPQNFVSRKAYRGINFFLLSAARFVSPYWLTFKQAQVLRGQVKKGEKSYPVVFWKKVDEKEDGETRKHAFLRYYNVFNIAQCDGIAVPQSEAAAPAFQPLERCEAVVAGMPRPPVIVHGSGRASYSPPLDIVTMPGAALFETPEAYYSALFHELTHATGHKSRLNREEVADPARYGSDPYSREELVAEMGAAFLSGHCGIDGATIEQSAGYIDHWLQRLKQDRRLVVLAAAQAQKACDFILGVPQTEGGENGLSQP